MYSHISHTPQDEDRLALAENNAPTWEELNAALARGPHELETFNRLDREMDWWVWNSMDAECYVWNSVTRHGGERQVILYRRDVGHMCIHTFASKHCRYDGLDELPEWLKYRPADVKEALVVCQKGPSKTGILAQVCGGHHRLSTTGL